MRTLASVSLAVCLLAGLMNPASADVFKMGGTRNADGSWNGLASLGTATVGNPSNPGDTRYPDTIHKVNSFGSVGYAYNIGKYEVTAGQYCEFLNKVAGVDTYGLYNTDMWTHTYGCRIERYAGNGTTVPYQYRVAADYANRPVNYVSFWDACRFTNWLHNGQPGGAQDNSTTEDGAYMLTPQGMINNTVSRNGNWQWAVPSEDEWYKAAYYNPGAASYYEFPTSSDIFPGRDFDDVSGNNANYHVIPYPAQPPYYTTVVGEFQNADSPYGTFDQGGNVWEMNEAILSTYRGVRGGSFDGDVNYLRASSRAGNYPPDGSPILGFRVVQVPEPTTLAILALSSLLLARRRRA